MSGTIEFVYDADNDVVVARPTWTIATPEDCGRWFRCWTDYLTTFGRKVDCIIVLDDFHVEPQVSVTWAEYRAQLTRDYHRFSCRVRSDWSLRQLILETSAQQNVTASEAESVEAALANIRRARRQAGVPERPAGGSEER
jgi:hypothetical protein